MCGAELLVVVVHAMVHHTQGHPQVQDFPGDTHLDNIESKDGDLNASAFLSAH